MWRKHKRAHDGREDGSRREGETKRPAASNCRTHTENCWLKSASASSRTLPCTWACSTVHVMTAKARSTEMTTTWVMRGLSQALPAGASPDSVAIGLGCKIWVKSTQPETKENWSLHLTLAITSLFRRNKGPRDTPRAAVYVRF